MVVLDVELEVELVEVVVGARVEVLVEVVVEVDSEVLVDKLVLVDTEVLEVLVL